MEFALWTRGAVTLLIEQQCGVKLSVRAEGAEIHWGDKTALINTDVRGRS